MANKLDEIFKDAPELLEHPSVKELIEYAREMHTRCYDSLMEAENKLTKIMGIGMHSEAFLIKGQNAISAIHQIMKAA